MSLLRQAAATAVCLLLPLAVAAEDEFLGPPRVGVIDSGRALAGSEQGREVERSLESLQKKKLEQLEPKTRKLRELRQSYEQKSLVLTPQARADLQLEIRQLERSVERDLEEARDELEIERSRQLTPILRGVMAAVGEVASDRKLEVVLEKASPGVFFHAERVDITDAVIESLNSGGPATSAR